MYRSRKLTERAKREGWKARSVYKLESIDKRYHLIKKGDVVLDLGCWPGSWLQYCVQEGARVVGVDMRATKIPGAETHVVDVQEDKIFLLLAHKRFAVVLSDLAPSTSGHREQDQYASYGLSRRAFQIAQRVLKQGGNFLVKIFQSRDAEEFLRELKGHFRFVKAFKPEGSRKQSKEIYFVCMGYRGCRG